MRDFVVKNFMVSRMGLNGNKLVLFALLWQMSAGGEKKVVCDHSKVSAAIGTTIPTMYNVLKELVKAGYIKQVEKGTYEVVVGKS